MSSKNKTRLVYINDTRFDHTEEGYANRRVLTVAYQTTDNEEVSYAVAINRAPSKTVPHSLRVQAVASKGNRISGVEWNAMSVEQQQAVRDAHVAQRMQRTRASRDFMVYTEHKGDRFVRKVGRDLALARLATSPTRLALLPDEPPLLAVLSNLASVSENRYVAIIAREERDWRLAEQQFTQGLLPGSVAGQDAAGCSNACSDCTCGRAEG